MSVLHIGHLEQVTILGGVNHKKVFGVFLVLHREMSTSQKNHFERCSSSKGDD